MLPPTLDLTRNLNSSCIISYKIKIKTKTECVVLLFTKQQKEGRFSNNFMHMHYKHGHNPLDFGHTRHVYCTVVFLLYKWPPQEQNGPHEMTGKMIFWRPHNRWTFNMLRKKNICFLSELRYYGTPTKRDTKKWIINWSWIELLPFIWSLITETKDLIDS